ncbi:lipopolysaccharide biosynthesis protein [Bradyrhizobium sp.]|uniref:lipopolysaccharide biosynthesis protein n=1 Tax=Bradyrhizobium sp. TaxID=376 RepID=UPI0039E4563B
MTKQAVAYFDDHKIVQDLGRRALRGGIVSLVMQYGNGALQLFGAVILARLLVPEDFGLVAIFIVVTSFAPMLIDFGLGEATAQRSRITPGQISSLFWFSAASGLVVALATAACSPLIASIFHDPRLEAITLCASITFALLGLSSQHMALLRRTMQFGAIARIQVSSTFVGVLVAILMARYGYGYWALVLRPIATALCVVIGSWTLCHWKPRRPVFDGEVKSMMRFGLHVVGFSVAYSMAKAVDRIGLGLFYRPDVVGYYQNATVLYEYSILLVISQAQAVGTPSLSKLRSDPAALRQKYEAALSVLAFFLMPTAAILSVTAQDVTVLLLGEKWHVAGALLSIVAVRGIFQVIEGSQAWLHLSLGRPDRWQNWGVVTLGFQLAAVVAGLPFGPTGVAAATVIVSLLIAVPSITYAGDAIGIDAALVMRAVGPQLIGSIAVLVAGWGLQTVFLSDYHILVRISFSVAFCSLLYLFIVAGVFRLTEPIRLVGSVAKDLLKAR